jgi:predicted nucleotidyltransferase
VKVRSVPRETVLATLAAWAASVLAGDPGVRRIGVFGSYARGQQTPASDVDVLVVVERSTRRPWERPLDLPIPPGPVGAELLVYTEAELEALRAEGSRWIAEVLGDIVWLDDEPSDRADEAARGRPDLRNP